MLCRRTLPALRTSVLRTQIQIPYVHHHSTISTATAFMRMTTDHIQPQHDLSPLLLPPHLPPLSLSPDHCCHHTQNHTHIHIHLAITITTHIHSDQQPNPAILSKCLTRRKANHL